MDGFFGFTAEKSRNGGSFQFILMRFSHRQDKLFASSGRDVCFVRTNWRKFSWKL